MPVQPPTLVLFNYDWDQRAFAALSKQWPHQSAGFDLFTFPSNVNLVWFDMVRFTNSGTESLMYAIRAARAYTQRKAIVKIEGGYHGGYDPLQVSVKPALADIGPADAPQPPREET